MKMATTKKDVTLPEIELETAVIRLVGTSPLITNPFPLKAMKAIEDKQQGKAKNQKHTIRNPWQDFIEAIYWLSEPPKEHTEEAFVDAVKCGARYGLHVGAIKNSAISAAYRAGVIKNQAVGRGLFRIRNTEMDKLYGKSCVEIITNEPPTMRKDCLSTFSSGADMRYRPQFDNWSIDVEIEFMNNLVTLEQIVNWFRLGGFACGLGENRAEKGAEAWGSYKIV